MKTKLIELVIIIVFLGLVSICFGAWDNDKPADNDAWNTAASSIRANWDALETVLGVDLTNLPITNYVANVKDATYGAEGDGSTDDTAAITAALATGYDVFFPAGTYLTTGNHRISTEGQVIYGEGQGKSIIKKSSGTNYIIDTTHAVNFIGLKDLTFDGNSLGGSCVIWRGHYSIIRNVAFKNQGGTSYCLFLSGVNLSYFENIMTYDGCYGGILADQSADGYAPQPTYSCMYSTFDNVSIAQTNGGSALKLAGASAQILTFNNFYFEDTQAAVYAIDIQGANCSNITFNHIRSEHVILTESLIYMNATYNIRFLGGRIASNIAQTELIFEINNTDGVSIENILFYDNYSLAGRTIIQLTADANVRIVGNTFSCLNNFNFITSISGNSYVTAKNNTRRIYYIATHPGTGTNLWNGTDYLTLSNSEFTQTLGTATNVNTSENLKIAIIDLTSAEVKALATAEELVAAQGAGTLIEFVSAMFILDYGSEVLAEPSAPDDLAIEYDDGTGTQIVTWDTTGFITHNADAYEQVNAASVGAGAQPIGAVTNVNKNIALINTGGNYTGNASNDTALRIIVSYRVHSSLSL